METVSEVRQIVRRLPLDVIDQSSKQSASSHQPRSFPVSSVVINCKLNVFLQLFLLFILASRGLNVVFDVPISGQGLDVVNILVLIRRGENQNYNNKYIRKSTFQSFHNIVLGVSLVEQLCKEVVRKGAALNIKITI